MYQYQVVHKRTAEYHVHFDIARLEMHVKCKDWQISGTRRRRQTPESDSDGESSHEPASSDAEAKDGSRNEWLVVY
jgi:hypothetical protein